VAISSSGENRTGKTISNYHVGALVGCGGMGEVYRGTDSVLERNVALKFLRTVSDPQMRARFIREAQTASLLDHPNICTVFEVEEITEGDLFIVMPYYDGETLDKILKKGALDADIAFEYAAQTARGLAAAHSDLIVHRDIKPANLMVTRAGVVKILDFGIAKLLKDRPLTDPTEVLGTPRYMSPEQLRGQVVDQRTDIWSLGVVFYELLTGTSPFERGDVAATITAVLNDRLPKITELIPDLPDSVDRVFDKLLARDRRNRYEQIELFLQDLSGLQSEFETGEITLRFPVRKEKASIAVLPFEDMSPARDQEYLCDGIAEEILRALGHVPDLHVTSRTSSFQFKNQQADMRDIGMRLNVENVLEGSVRKAGDRVRISAQLVSVDNGYRLWYERYDRDMQDIFAVQDEIAEQIAEALKVKLIDEPVSRGYPNAPKVTESYDLYLQGRRFFHQHRRKSLEIAIQAFTDAIEADPTFARAYAGIADCYSFLSLYFGMGEEAVVAADEASAKALEMQPELADANCSRGLALFLRREYEEAEEHMRKAIELDPKIYESHYIFGRISFSRGQMDKAARHFRDACRLVPEAFDSWYLLGMCYRNLGEKNKARRADRECSEAVFKRVRSNPDDTRALTMGASILVALGEPERAMEWIERALAIDPEEPIIQYNSACAYVNLNKFEEALNCLELAVGQSSLSREWVLNDPDLDPLRADPRFKALLDESNEV
jgi:serine/threonine protein kinase/tetratricopeptide (TPR) repeat protein